MPLLPTLARKPYCPSMRVELMSTSVTLLFMTMEVTRQSAMSRSFLIWVPGALLRKGRRKGGRCSVCVCVWIGRF